MTTFITRLTSDAGGPRLAVKDIIDVKDTPTTAGSRAVQMYAVPACEDADCVSKARAAGARLVGKVNLHELALGPTGINHWFGTPRNPLNEHLIPGGSSSGSAVAVADEEADIALGTDTGGSIRVPSACCGVVGLKTTNGRISTQGVRPVSVSQDTVGLLAKTTAGIGVGMQLLETGFQISAACPTTFGRVRLPGIPKDPVVDAMVDLILSELEVDIVEVDLPSWSLACDASVTIQHAEFWTENRDWLSQSSVRQYVEQDILQRFDTGGATSSSELAAARKGQERWKRELDQVFRRCEVLALPTLTRLPPTIDEAGQMRLSTLSILTRPANIAGIPALAIPLKLGSRIGSIQLLGPAGSESRLLAAGAAIEAARD